MLRFANRVPLQYQPGACAITEAVYETNWKNYTLSQPQGLAAGRADGDLGPPRERLGALHQRGQGSGRALRRDPARDPLRAPGVRTKARAPSCARATAPRARRAAAICSSATSPSSARASARSPARRRPAIEKLFFTRAAELREKPRGCEQRRSGGRRCAEPR